MYWTQIKSALLYGQPSMTNDMFQPQAVQIAVREISRLVSSGWVEELTEDVRTRIQTACQKSQCPELWNEFQLSHPQLQRKRTKTKNKKRQKKIRTPVSV